MTKEELIKKFVELCGDLAISNDSVSEETVLNFINSIQSKENNGWIKIESEEDLPKESGYFFTKSDVWWEPYYRIDIFCGKLSNSFENGKSCFTHYQPIVKPLKPIY